MAEKSFKIFRVNTLPATGNNGDKYLLIKSDNRYEEYVVQPNGTLAFIKGITDDQNTRLERFTTQQASKLEGLKTQQEINEDIANATANASANLIRVSGTVLPRGANVPDYITQTGKAELSGGNDPAGVTYTNTGTTPSSFTVPQGNIGYAYYTRATDSWELLTTQELPQTEIIDNTASFNIEAALSANQGRILNEVKDDKFLEEIEIYDTAETINGQLWLDGSFSNNEQFALKIIPVKKGDNIRYEGYNGVSTTSESNPFPVIMFFNSEREYVSTVAVRIFPAGGIRVSEGVMPDDGFAYVNSRTPFSGNNIYFKGSKNIPVTDINKTGGVAGYDLLTKGKTANYNSTAFINGLMRATGLVSTTQWKHTDYIPVEAGQVVERHVRIDSNIAPNMVWFDENKANGREYTSNNFDVNNLTIYSDVIEKKGFVVINNKVAGISATDYYVSILETKYATNKDILAITPTSSNKIEFGIVNVNTAYWSVLNSSGTYTLTLMQVAPYANVGIGFDNSKLKQGDIINLKLTIDSEVPVKVFASRRIEFGTVTRTLIDKTTSGIQTYDVSFPYNGENNLFIRGRDMVVGDVVTLSNIEITNLSYNDKYVLNEYDKDSYLGDLKTVREDYRSRELQSFFNDQVNVQSFKMYPIRTQNQAYSQSFVDHDEIAEVIGYSNPNGDILIGMKFHDWSDYKYTNLTKLLPSIFIKQLNDNHNDTAVVLTKEGYIIVTSNMHAQANTCRCAISVRPYDISQFVELKYTTERVTYPVFIKHSDKRVMVFWRDGLSGSGDYWCANFDDLTKTWVGAKQLINGTDVSHSVVGTAISPYLNSVVVDKQDRIRISLGFREDPQDANSNFGMYYLQSADWGATWTHSDGVTQYTLPTYSDSLERVVEIPTGTGYINQSGAVCDDSGNYFTGIWQDLNDGNGNIYTQTMVIKCVGGIWSTDIITNDTFRNIFSTTQGYLSYRVASRPVFYSHRNKTYLLRRAVDDITGIYQIDVDTKQKTLVCRMTGDSNVDISIEQNYLKKGVLCFMASENIDTQEAYFFLIKKKLW